MNCRDVSVERLYFLDFAKLLVNTVVNFAQFANTMIRRGFKPTANSVSPLKWTKRKD
jgi:hypothetical protein